MRTASLVLILSWAFLGACSTSPDAVVDPLVGVDLSATASAQDAKIVSFVIDDDGFIEIEYQFFPENLTVRSAGTLGTNNALNNLGIPEYNTTGAESGILVTSVAIQVSGGLDQETREFTDLEITPITTGTTIDRENKVWNITTSENLLFSDEGAGSLLETDGNGVLSFTGQFLRPTDYDVYNNLIAENIQPVLDPYQLGVFDDAESYVFSGVGAVLEEQDGFTIKIRKEEGHLLRYDVSEFKLKIYSLDGTTEIDEATMTLVP